MQQLLSFDQENPNLYQIAVVSGSVVIASESLDSFELVEATSRQVALIWIDVSEQTGWLDRVWKTDQSVTLSSSYWSCILASSTPVYHPTRKGLSGLVVIFQSLQDESREPAHRGVYLVKNKQEPASFRELCVLGSGDASSRILVRNYPLLIL